MLFNSIEFAIFLPIVVCIYYCLSHRAQNIMLLIASYIFYGWWDWRFLVLLFISTTTDYWVGRVLGVVTGRRRKLILIISLVANLGFLGFFKYFNFFVDSMGQALHLLGLHADLPLLHIVLPVGISFYTFQSLSYVIDVYNGVFEAEKSFTTYALFVSYFPHMVAGPIQRASNLLTKLNQPRYVDDSKIYSGALLMLIGYFKKMAIADSVAPMVAQAFAQSSTASWMVLTKGIWLFTIQIYCDFSGYTDIARGASRLMGIDLMENFNQPYLSRNITEFWRRWHISLSTWLRDYLYIPLGGNRHGKLLTYRNLMITMLLGGLWHGANWTFIAWGTLHGMFLAIHKWMLDTRKSVQATPTTGWWVSVRQLLLVLGTLHLVMLAWVFFRAPSISEAMVYLEGIFSFRGGLHAVHPRDLMTVAFFAALVLLIDWPQYHSKNHTIILTWSWPKRGVAIASMALLLLLMGENSDTPFIYFQF